MIKIKFSVQSTDENGSVKTITLKPALMQPEDKTNWLPTAFSEIKLQTVNSEAAAKFLIGEEYIVSFEKCQ